MKLLTISGALRRASLNTLLVRHAAREISTDYQLADLNLPLYSGDIEEAGIPVSVQTLEDQIASTDTMIISTPEYNKNISGVLKNALDWVSQTSGNPWAGKPVAIMSATAGRSGRERAQNSLRLCLQLFATRLLNGPEVLVGSAHHAFASGILINERYQKAVGALMAALLAEVSMR